jgi:hypothetical protein
MDRKEGNDTDFGLPVVLDPPGVTGVTGLSPPGLAGLSADPLGETFLEIVNLRVKLDMMYAF